MSFLDSLPVDLERRRRLLLGRPHVRELGVHERFMAPQPS